MRLQMLRRGRSVEDLKDRRKNEKDGVVNGSNKY
jgi:hypothetical protein